MTTVGSEGRSGWSVPGHGTRAVAGRSLPLREAPHRASLLLGAEPIKESVRAGSEERHQHVEPSQESSHLTRLRRRGRVGGWCRCRVELKGSAISLCSESEGSQNVWPGCGAQLGVGRVGSASLHGLASLNHWFTGEHHSVPSRWVCHGRRVEAVCVPRRSLIACAHGPDGQTWSSPPATRTTCSTIRSTGIVAASA